MKKRLQYFENTLLSTAVAQFFKDLEVPLNLASDAPARLTDVLEKHYHERFGNYTGDVFWVGQVDDNAFEGIKSGASELAKIRGKNYDTILVFALEISRHDEQGNEALPTRTQLFDLARAFNREFPYQPVVLFFRYNGHFISVAVVERNDYKAKGLEGDKIGKMSLLRDVDVLRPHAGHERILLDMQIPRSGKNAVTTFDTLYRHWQQVLNVSVLNKKFYQELSNWYFWAVHHVRFPGEPTDGDAENLKTHRANNVIRLITRLIFTWFLKEKKLVPETLFDLDELASDYVRFKSVTPDNSTTSEYYLAILQNLFFGTLNQEMDARRFKIESTVHPHPDYAIKNVYRHSALFKDTDTAPDLFKSVPFLNGGLFECLDELKKVADKYKEYLIDGFSDTQRKQPTVPNFLFFQRHAETVVLQDDFLFNGKKYTGDGIIRILKSYKFTISENTPLEEEVALDPELLGRIFENLLAEFNPETKTTARKQTGSFYTPREIVQYMVDQSLIAYLQNKMSERWQGRQDELKTNLHNLFGEMETSPFTDPEDVDDLIAALDSCKILDPACGSGAFPMGILHRMVALLDKLDPKNEKWKQFQVKNAQRIGISETRKEAIESIERAFSRNKFSYARKLFLIENCIFGVDIQPTAVQIAKLRFFISLICDQSIDDTQENRGILALPNLETKFVAANALIGPEDRDLASEVVESLLDERKNLHHQMFSAKNYTEKKRFREEDEELRAKIKEKLDASGWLSEDEATQLANWNLFNQNFPAKFFDPQWMFGVKEGFDIIIGNPPYISYYSNTGSFLTKKERKYFVSNFDSVKKENDRINSMNLFSERAIKLLANNGNLTFIVNKTFAVLPSYLEIRKFFLQNTEFNFIVSGLDPFEAIIDCLIYSCRKNNDKSKNYSLNWFDGNIENYVTIDINNFKKNPNLELNFSKNNNIINQIESANGKLQDIIIVNRGINIGGHFDLFLSENKKTDEHFKFISGIKSLSKFTYRWDEKSDCYFKFDQVLESDLRDNGATIALGNPKRYLTDRLFIPESSQTLIASFASERIYSAYGIMVATEVDTAFNIKYACALLNSKLFTFYAIQKEILRKGAKATPHIGVKGLNSIPVVLLSKFKQLPFINLVTIIIYIQNYDHLIFITQTFERVLDGMVCELYFGELMREKEVNILDQVELDLAPFAAFESFVDAEKDAAIQQLHAVWTHPDSIVRNRLALMAVRSADVLGVILEGK